MTIKELMPLLEAMDRGGVQYRNIEWNSGEWEDISTLNQLLSLALSNYYTLRIKPAPKYFVPKVGETAYYVYFLNTKIVAADYRIIWDTDVYSMQYFSTREKAQACADELQNVLDKHREITND